MTACRYLAALMARDENFEIDLTDPGRGHDIGFADASLNPVLYLRLAVEGICRVCRIQRPQKIIDIVDDELTRRLRGTHDLEHLRVEVSEEHDDVRGPELCFRNALGKSDLMTQLGYRITGNGAAIPGRRRNSIEEEEDALRPRSK